MMQAELLSIGDELLIGQVVNTNAVFLSKALNSIGIEVVQISCISDQKEAIIEALDESKKRAQIILLTGGLGPTKDDITKHTLCVYFNDILVENQEIKTHIEHIFSSYVTTPINQENRKQALLPSKARILKNEHGTASGMWFEKDNQVIIALPGVPFEMKALVNNHVLPALKEKYTLPYIKHITIQTYGLGESAIAERLIHWENELPRGLKFAYLPNFGKVRLRLSGKDFNSIELTERMEAEIDKLIPIIKDIYVGRDEDSIEQIVHRKFIQKKATLSLAESCTGGQIATLLTSIPGASAYFKGGVVAYQTQSKIDLLSVPKRLIDQHSVVSQPVAEAMAKNVQKHYHTDYAIATTGNAGPTKGDADAEIGTVWIAVASKSKVISEKFVFGNHRERVIHKAVQKALELVLQHLK